MGFKPLATMTNALQLPTHLRIFSSGLWADCRITYHGRTSHMSMSQIADIPTGRRRHGPPNLYNASPNPQLSQSMKDVLEVAPDDLCNDKELKIKNKSGSASNLMSLESKGHHKARQDHENEPAEVVIVCEPEGTSLMMGGLHPRQILRYSFSVPPPDHFNADDFEALASATSLEMVLCIANTYC